MDEMKHLKMEIMRYNPETDSEPHFVTYDVLTIRRHLCLML